MILNNKRAMLLGTSRGNFGLLSSSISFQRWKYSSNVQTKLNHFLESGEIIRRTPQQSKNQTNVKVSGAYSPQKAVSIIQNVYEGKLQRVDGTMINVNRLTANDINVASEKSLELFKGIKKVKIIGHKPVDKRLLLTLLGTNAMQIKDPFLVTRDVLKLLERDNDTARAEELARLAGTRGGVVAMNAILQWHFDHGDIASGLKCFNNRKKWGIPITLYTYTILFHGIAKASSWGEVSAADCQKYMGVFDTFMSNSANDEEIDTSTKCTVEHFNACLSILVRCFEEDQSYAWSFFDKLIPDPKSSLPRIIPTCQTFTILLNGVKRKAQSDAELVNLNSKLSRDEKAVKLMEIRSNLTAVADQILDKVLENAVPPIPPTKEEAESNPETLSTYRQKSRRQLVDLDEAFVTVYVSCYINSLSSSQLLKNSRNEDTTYGLTCLKVWCPEVKKIIEFASSKNSDGNPIINNTSVDADKLNPLVTFPPSLLSQNKKKAIFSGKRKPLVDFSRHTSAEVRTMFQHKQFISSKGKYGKRASDKFIARFNGKKSPVNKFILMLVLDGLLSLGKFQEFYLAVWYILTKWGSMALENADMLAEAQKRGFSNGLIPLSARSAVRKQGNLDTGCVDIMMVENFIYKIAENFPYQQLLFSGRNVVEVLRAVVCVNNEQLQIRPKTIDAVFSALTSDVHHFNDSNYNRIMVDSRRSKVPNNAPKKSFSDQQLMGFLPVLDSLMDTLLLHQKQQGKRGLTAAQVDSYNKLIERIYRSTWLPQNSQHFYEIHKSIIRSGILFYTPKSIQDPRLKLPYSEIEPSVKFVLDGLRQRKDLNKEEVQLMLALRLVQALESKDSDAASKMQHLSKKIHSMIPITGISCT